jgi:hypothetical protein
MSTKFGPSTALTIHPSLLSKMKLHDGVLVGENPGLKTVKDGYVKQFGKGDSIKELVCQLVRICSHFSDWYQNNTHILRSNRQSRNSKNSISPNLILQITLVWRIRFNIPIS